MFEILCCYTHAIISYIPPRKRRNLHIFLLIFNVILVLLLALVHFPFCGIALYRVGN
jgi:hypothetical protein